MRSFRDFSINTKLNLLVTVAGGVALLLSCAAFVVNDYRTLRASKVRQLTALATVLGSNSTAALTFDDPSTGKEILASLREQPTIMFACLYDAEGDIFAVYGAPPENHHSLPPGTDGHRFTEQGYLDVTRHIVEDGQPIGTMHIRATMADLHAQLRQYAAIVAVVMVVSLGGSILLSSRLQRVVSLPILRLADAAQKISEAGDYSIRVTKDADDELGTLYDEFNNMLDRIQEGEAQLQQAHDDLEDRVEKRTRQLSETNLELSRQVIERQRAEGERDEAHHRLVETARQAGMAEIATGVLHNVGNVLNSVNVSAALVSDRLRNLKLDDMTRAVDMIKAHEDDLGAFLATDEKGKLLPGFLTMLGEHFNQERAALLEELQSLGKNVDHVKTIVSMQQSYAGVAGVVEAVSLADLVDDALQLNMSSFEKHGVEVVREFAELPEVNVEKQKLLQILVNLITNAKDALIESDRSDRRLTVRILRPDDDCMRVEVADNGLGIARENLVRVFSHGFTTKRHGHGFGLHASANAAKEIGGSLFVESDGLGQGATFFVEFPFVPLATAAP